MNNTYIIREAVPDGAEFQRMELSRDLSAEIRKVETDG